MPKSDCISITSVILLKLQQCKEGYYLYYFHLTAVYNYMVVLEKYFERIQIKQDISLSSCERLITNKSKDFTAAMPTKKRAIAKALQVCSDSAQLLWPLLPSPSAEPLALSLGQGYKDLSQLTFWY